MRRFYAVLDSVRDELDAKILGVAASLPAFAPVLANQNAAQAKARAAQDRARERAALSEGAWAPYLGGLREQGKTFARLGVAFRDWYALLTPYRAVIWKKVIPPELTAAFEVLSGMNTFLDIAMSTIANAYIETKEELVRAAERELNLHRRMFESSSLGKLILEWEEPPDEGTFRLVAANPRASAVTGRELQGHVGLRLEDLGDAAQLRQMLMHLVQVVNDGKPQEWTAEIRRAGEPQRTFEVRAFSLGGRHVGVVFDDVTQRHTLARELERHVQELERSNRDLDEFAYVASHDLKAPLRDIDNLAAWIAQDASALLPERTRGHLQRLQERVNRMERLLDDLLGYSRAGRDLSPAEDIDVASAIRSAADLASLPAGFAVEVVGQAAPLRAPRAAVELVIRNLIANAVKHHDRKEGRLQAVLRDAADALQISVTDDGPGIPPQFHERVFRMFQTLKPRDEVEGSGMGLAIVKKTMEAHGGSVRLESAPPRGTTFHLCWPRAGSKS